MIEPLSDRLRPLKFSVYLSGKWGQRDININIIAEIPTLPDSPQHSQQESLISEHQRH